MIEAVLLDMDGTLLDIDFQQFMTDYIRRVVGRLARLGHDPEHAARQLIDSSRMMVLTDDPTRTVLDVFMDDFSEKLPLPADQFDVFWQFYAEEYKELGRWGKPIPGARDFVESLFAADVRVAIATAPMFPKVAIKERLRWAGVDEFPYDFVTAADTVHYAKPFPGFYRQIAEQLQVAPERCIMIGDEHMMDGGAAHVGMRTLLVGPEKRSNMLDWFPEGFGEQADELPRYESLTDVAAALREQGVL